MSTQVNIDVTAHHDRSAKDFDRLGDSVERSAGKMAKLRKIIGSATGGAVGVTVAAVEIAGGELVKATKAAIVDQAAQTKLAKALRNAAGARKGDIAATEAWVSKQGKALGVTDDELRPALGRLVTATGDVGRAQKLARLGMDVSAGTGKSLKQVTEALARAEDGQVAGLSRLGIATKDASGRTKSFAEIHGELQKRFGGQAATAANTLEGKMGRLKLVMAETGENIGHRLIPPLTVLAGWMLTKGIPAVRAWWRAMRTVWGPVLGLAGRAIGGLVDRFRSAEGGTSKLGAHLSGVTGEVGRVARVVGGNLRPVLSSIGGVLREQFAPTLALVAAKFQEWRPTLERMLAIGGRVLGWLLRTGSLILGKVLPPILKFAGFLAVGFVKALVGVIDRGVRFVGWLVNLPKTIRTAWERVRKFPSFLKGSFTGALGKAGDSGQTMGGKLWGGIASVGGKLAGLGGWAWGMWKRGNATLYGRLFSLASSAGDKLWSGITSIGKTLSDFGGWAWGKLGGNPGKLKLKVTGVGGSLIRGLVSGLGDVWEKVKEDTKKPLGKLLRYVVAPFCAALRPIATALGAASKGIKGIKSLFSKVPWPFRHGGAVSVPGSSSRIATSRGVGGAGGDPVPTWRRSSAAPRLGGSKASLAAFGWPSLAPLVTAWQQQAERTVWTLAGAPMLRVLSSPAVSPGIRRRIPSPAARTTWAKGASAPFREPQFPVASGVASGVTSGLESSSPALKVLAGFVGEELKREVSQPRASEPRRSLPRPAVARAQEVRVGVKGHVISADELVDAIVSVVDAIEEGNLHQLSKRNGLLKVAG